MTRFIKLFASLAIMSVLLMVSLEKSHAALVNGRAVVGIDFEGPQHLEAFQFYYNGGVGSSGSGPGPNFGTTFESSAIAVKNPPISFQNQHDLSSKTLMTFLVDLDGVTEQAVTLMQVPSGFVDFLSFYYSGPRLDFYQGEGTPTLVEIFSEFNPGPQAQPLATSGQLSNTSGGTAFSDFRQVVINFTGIARSVRFTSPELQLAIDNLAFAISNPITLFLMIVGLLALGIVRVTQRSKNGLTGAAIDFKFSY